MTKTEADAEYSALTHAIGLEITRCRQQRGLTVEETARRADISVASIQAIEAGHARLTLRQLHRLGQVFDTSLFALLAGSAQEPDTAESREFIDAYDRIKDRVLKDQISTLVSTVAMRLSKQDA